MAAIGTPVGNLSPRILQHERTEERSSTKDGEGPSRGGYQRLTFGSVELAPPATKLSEIGGRRRSCRTELLQTPVEPGCAEKEEDSKSQEGPADDAPGH